MKPNFKLLGISLQRVKQEAKNVECGSGFFVVRVAQVKPISIYLAFQPLAMAKYKDIEAKVPHVSEKRKLLLLHCPKNSQQANSLKIGSSPPTL